MLAESEEDVLVEVQRDVRVIRRTDARYSYRGDSGGGAMW